MVYLKNSKQYLLLIVALSFLAMSLLIHQNLNQPKIIISKQESAVNINRNFLKFISLGNKRIISSIFWIQTLLESDEVKYNKNDKNNWMYHRFITISELDPFFYENYLWGGVYLSIIKDDVLGAADIYERGLLKYPLDYKLNYNAGFNYYFEMGNFDAGLKILEKIEKHPEANHGLPFIINKLRFQTSGDYEVALDYIKFQFNNTNDPVLKKKLAGDFYSLKADRDLNCLNLKKNNCERIDANGLPYKLVNGSWKAPQAYKNFKIHLRKK